MATRYWVVSLPVQNSATSLWNRLQEQISKHSFDTPLYRVLTHSLISLEDLFLLLQFHVIMVFLFFFFFIWFFQFNVPNLRVGTLDSLLSLSDDLQKVIPPTSESNFEGFFFPDSQNVLLFFLFSFWILDTNFVNLFLFLSLFWFTESVISWTYFCGYLIANLALIWIQFRKLFYSQNVFLLILSANFVVLSSFFYQYFMNY